MAPEQQNNNKETTATTATATASNKERTHNKLRFQEGDLIVDNSGKSLFAILVNMLYDFITVIVGTSPLPKWVRLWVGILLTGMLIPLPFLPHPFAIANVFGMVFILIFNGKELIRVRGVNKNMGWPHIVAYEVVLAVNVVCLSTDIIDGQQLTWANANGDAYEQARVFAVWYNTAVLGISFVFDCVDTYQYNYGGGTVADVAVVGAADDRKAIDRSEWTVKELKNLAVNTNDFTDGDPDVEEESEEGRV